MVPLRGRDTTDDHVRGPWLSLSDQSSQQSSGGFLTLETLFMVRGQDDERGKESYFYWRSSLYGQIPIWQTHFTLGRGL